MEVLGIIFCEKVMKKIQKLRLFGRRKIFLKKSIYFMSIKKNKKLASFILRFIIFDLNFLKKCLNRRFFIIFDLLFNFFFLETTRFYLLEELSYKINDFWLRGPWKTSWEVLLYIWP